MKKIGSKCFLCLLLAILLTVFASGCGSSSAEADASLLEFPGVHWNDTPEAVISALDISEKNILANEEVTTSTENAREWALVVSNLNCFGKKAQYVQFRFISYDGTDDSLGLSYVRIDYPESTDMSAVQKRLVKLYGDGSSECPPNYVLRDGTVTEDTSAQSNTEANAHSLYWTASVSPAEYLSTDVQDNIIRAFAQRELDPIRRDAVESWLEVQPLTQMSWSDDANSLFRDDSQYITANEVFLDGRALVFYMQNYT